MDMERLLTQMQEMLRKHEQRLAQLEQARGASLSIKDGDVLFAHIVALEHIVRRLQGGNPLTNADAAEVLAQVKDPALRERVGVQIAQLLGVSPEQLGLGAWRTVEE